MYAFGVLLWEIFSFGEHPWANKNLEQVAKSVLLHETLEQPRGCPDLFYSLILDCCKPNPDQRPNFREILQRVSKNCDILGDELSSHPLLR